MVDDSFPGSNVTKGTYCGPQGSELDSVFLRELGVGTVKNDLVPPLTGLAAVALTPDPSLLVNADYAAMRDDFNPMRYHAKTHLIMLISL